MKTLVVMASSKTKTSKNETAFFSPSKTVTGSLDTYNRNRLLKARSELLTEFNYDEGPDTHPDKQSSTGIAFLPAYTRYSGRTYSRITGEAWTSLLKGPDEFDCLILSALYGLLRFDEPTRNYGIKQTTKTGSGKTIGKYWRDCGAGEWVFAYVKNSGVDHVKFVLSTEYSDIVGKESLMQRLKGELGIPSEDRQFKQGGMQSMVVRGQYINDLFCRKRKDSDVV